MFGYSNEEKLKFSSIMFQSPGQNPYPVHELSQEQRKKLQALYAQKIIYQTVNDRVVPPQPTPVVPEPKATAGGGILQTICCCFYPQSQRDNFDITTWVFIKRILGTLLFCKSDWCEIGQKPQLYGWLWLNFSYVLSLAIAANLNQYYILPTGYQFKTFYLIKALGITFLFGLALPFIYSAVLKCLGGHIETIQSLSLYGYSLFLAIIPTAFCLIPSLFWHVGMLALAGTLKGIFLFRNYGSKLDARSFVLLAVIVIFELLEFLIVIKVFFPRTAGSSVSQGTNKVFHYRIFSL